MSFAAGDSSARTRPPRTPKCSRCRNHGLLVPVRGHSGRCLWKLCTCPKCSLITERHKILAAHKLLRKSGNTAASPEGSGGGGGETGAPEPTENTAPSQPRPVHPGPPMFPSECVPSMEYFERETTRMFLGCPPMYHYPAFSIGLPPPGFRGAPPGIPLRAIRQCHPLQDGGGDFHQGYYPPVPPFMPPGYLPGIHFMPPTVPMSVSVMAEPRRAVSGQISSESFKIVSERSETPST